MNLDPVDFFPGYDPCRCLNSQRGRSRQECCSSFWINLSAVLLSVFICLIGIYYYEIADKGLLETWNKPRFEQRDQNVEDPLEEFRKEIKCLKAKIDQTDIWRKHLEELYTKIYHTQESEFQKKIGEAIDLYDSDRIGLFDFAATYARGSIYSIPYTIAYPVNRTISFFNLVNINVLSNPENILQPNNFPGNCFAFVGDKGSVRIKLGKKIVIRAITMDHIRLYEDKSSAPRDFEVYGLTNPDYEDSGTLLGSFTYDVNGRPIQTFQIHRSLSFEYVDLRILNNYGKKEFTCIYRFRVHNVFIERD